MILYLKKSGLKSYGYSVGIEETKMSYKVKRKSAVQCRNDYNDRIALTKSTFEWFYAVVITVLIAGFVFSFVFRICFIAEKNKEAVGLMLSADTSRPITGDNIVVSNNGKQYIAKMIADEGQKIIADSKNSEFSVDFVQIKYISQSTVEELEKLCDGNMSVPDGYAVVLTYLDYSENNHLTAQLIKTGQISGKIHSVLYPIVYFGKSVNAVRELNIFAE